MLVLSRQEDETVVIDFAAMSDAQLLALRKTPLQVTCVEIRGDKTRLGFTAPKPVAVHRYEVWEAIRRENRAAASKLGKAPPASAPTAEVEA